MRVGRFSSDEYGPMVGLLALSMGIDFVCLSTDAEFPMVFPLSSSDQLHGTYKPTGFIAEDG